MIPETLRPNPKVSSPAVPQLSQVVLRSLRRPHDVLREGVLHFSLKRQSRRMMLAAVQTASVTVKRQQHIRSEDAFSVNITC